MKEYQWVEGRFELGDWALQKGGMLRRASLAYMKIGELNAEKDNLVVLPVYYGGAMRSILPWVGAATGLVPDRFCIVIPALFGAGESTSPSNSSAQPGPEFPLVTLYDNVRAQRELIRDLFDDAELALVMGWSMGGMQALHWAGMFAHKVKHCLALCCTSQCSAHNRVFLEGVRAALVNACDFNDGYYSSPPERGLTAFARVYLGWAYSQEFFRNGSFKELGFASVEALMRFWEQDHLAQDANNLLAVLATWGCGDVADNDQHLGDLAAALGGISCPVTLMPGSTDLYFTMQHLAAEAALIGHARVEPLQSDWGHIVGGPGRHPLATRAIRRQLAQWLGALPR